MVEVCVGALDVKIRKECASQSPNSFFRVLRRRAFLSPIAAAATRSPLCFPVLSPNTHTLCLPPMAPKADKQKKAQDKAKQAARQKVREREKKDAGNWRAGCCRRCRSGVPPTWVLSVRRWNGAGWGRRCAGGRELSLRDRWKNATAPHPTFFTRRPTPTTTTHPPDRGRQDLRPQEQEKERQSPKVSCRWVAGWFGATRFFL